MSVEGKVTDGKTLYLRTQLSTGEIEGEPYSICLNIDNKAIFVEFEKGWVVYSIVDMLKDAYEQLKK